MAEYKDYMVRAMAANRELRAFAVTSRDLVEEARKIHGMTPVAAAALGRTMSGALMMSYMLKGDDSRLTIQFKGDGPMGPITVTADNKGNVKGLVRNPMVVLPLKNGTHLDVGGAVGHGTLNVMRDIDKDHTYNGQVLIHSGEIADDLTYYFAESEQIRSSVGLGVKVEKDLRVGAAGGFIIQLMPFASEETISKLEENIRECEYVTDMLAKGMTPEEIIQEVLKGFDVEFTEKMPVRFHCDCSRDRVTRALKLIGEDELRSLAEDNQDQEMVCHFCGKKYKFTAEEIRGIYGEFLKEKAERAAAKDSAEKGE
ncbi:MAG: Hsp33 family molecular chaperone HslO [Eubacteriales bacterium]|nr:Hsp33 family molecular chaperone HslO [Eubacteriales bacterium]